MIDLEQKRKWDEYAIRDYAVKTGIEEGLAQGLEKGLAQGLEKGERIASIKIAKALLAKGISPDIVLSATGLSTAVLRKLK